MKIVFFFFAVRDHAGVGIKVNVPFDGRGVGANILPLLNLNVTCQMVD